MMKTYSKVWPPNNRLQRAVRAPPAAEPGALGRINNQP